MFGPGGSFFVWVGGMGGGTNGQAASGAAAWSGPGASE